MIGFLRFVGVLNAAIWLGATVFYTVCVSPALSSQAMRSLFGATYFPFLSGGVNQELLTRYFYLQLACSIIALLHLLAERLYLSRIAPQWWLSLLVALFVLSSSGAFWISPKLKSLHQTRYALNVPAEAKQAAVKSFNFWHGVYQAVNVMLFGGVAVYLWRMANPPDSLRFVSPGKFRG